MAEPDRKLVKAKLREAKLSARQIHALLARGWRGLVDERMAEAAELRDQLDELQKRLAP
jgi:hypothetical protein